MKTFRNTEMLALESGIYFNSKACRRLINKNTRIETIKRKMSRRFTDTNYIESKIKIAASIFIVVVILSKVFIG